MCFLNKKIFLIANFSLASNDDKSWFLLPWGNTWCLLSLCIFENFCLQVWFFSHFPDLILCYFSGVFRSWTHSGFKVWCINSLLAFHFFSAIQVTILGSTKQVCSIACDLGSSVDTEKRMTPLFHLCWKTVIQQYVWISTQYLTFRLSTCKVHFCKRLNQVAHCQF